MPRAIATVVYVYIFLLQNLVSCQEFRHYRLTSKGQGYAGLRMVVHSSATSLRINVQWDGRE